MSRRGSPAEQMLRDLSRLGDVVFQEALRAARKEAADVVVESAKNTTLFVRRSGKLEKGIKVSHTKHRTQVRSTAPHSWVVEKGHGGPQPAGPIPFMETAARSTGRRQMRAAVGAIDAALRKLHKL